MPQVTDAGETGERNHGKAFLPPTRKKEMTVPQVAARSFFGG